MSECDESTALRTCCMDLSHLFPFCSSFCIISVLGNKTTLFFIPFGTLGWKFLCCFVIQIWPTGHPDTLCVSLMSVPTGALREEQTLWKGSLAGILKGCTPSSVWSLAGSFSFGCTVLFLCDKA